jgi:RNA polymerase sigma factor (sigma-70 family)
MDDPSHLRTRPSLLCRLADPSDGDAWRAFVDTYAPLVYRFCRRRGAQDADAADVTQEVLAQVSRSMPAFRYDPARGRFRDWLWAVVRSKLGRFRKSDARVPVPTGENLDTEATPADPEWVAEFQARLVEVALTRVAGEFSSDHWRAFERTWRDGAAAGVVAAELGLSVSAVYVAKCRAVARLREEIAHLADDLPDFT